MQYFLGRVGQKILWVSKTSTNFCPKIILFTKKHKVFTGIRLGFFTFLPKIMVFSKKKKSSPKICPRFFTFHPKIVVFSKEKSSPRITSPFSNFVPKQRCSLLGSEIKVMAQKFVGHAKHDLHALAARHSTQAQLNVFCLNVF